MTSLDFADTPPAEILKWIFDDPSQYFYGVDWAQRVALFAELDETDYRRSSFFDARINSRQSQPSSMPLDILRRVFAVDGPAASTVDRLRYIFHVGHCGSTLVSRMLDSGGQHGIWEPLLLRDLARNYRLMKLGRPGAMPPSDFAEVVGVFSRLAARTWRGDDQLSIVKTSSYAANLAAPLFDAHPAIRALFISVSPEYFLAAMLRSEANVKDLGISFQRYRTLDLPLCLDRLGLEESELSVGEKAAVSYAATELMLRAPSISNRVRRYDFDLVIADPSEALADMCTFLGCDIDEAAALEEMGVYAKGDRRPFSPADRNASLSASLAANRREVDRGLALIESALGA